MSNDLYIEIIKTDLRNDIESGMLNPHQQLIAINTALRDLASIDDEKIEEIYHFQENIKKYRNAQGKLEDEIIKMQKDFNEKHKVEITEIEKKKQRLEQDILDNAKNIYEHLVKEL